MDRPLLSAALALLLVLPACAPNAPSAPSRYSGDGTLTRFPPAMNEPWRTEIVFEPVPLLTPGSHTYRLSGLPVGGEHMLVALRINDATPEMLDAIDAAGVRVRVIITNLGSGLTSVKEGRLLADFETTYEGWADAVGGRPAEFAAVWFRPARHDAYTLRIDVTLPSEPYPNSAAGAPPLPATTTLTPIVRGRAGDALGGVGNRLAPITPTPGGR
jgi:hypothetical protein